MVAVHLNKQIDDIFSGYSKLETPDERREHKVEGNMICEGFEELIRQYEGVLAIHYTRIVQEGFGKINSILEPQQINSFLQATKRYEDHENYSDNTGLFITHLIQNSHNAGNNKFTLNTKALCKDIDGLGNYLKGKENNLLEIIVDGNIGRCCGQCAKNIGKLSISGNTGYRCGTGAESIGQIYIGGKTGGSSGDEAKYSTFKTPNLETLQMLKEWVPRDENNKIYFIHPNSQEEEIKW
ncbi:MAG: hypothetical protein ABIB71_06905 [Candidatus Woesearchaeota archaeon]